MSKIARINQISKRFRPAVKAGGIGYAGILGFVLISNFSIFNPNWPFGLFASFMSFLIVAFPFVLGALFVVWRKAIPPVIGLALLAFYPFYTFDKMVNPSKESCHQIDCVTVVAANLRHNAYALKELAKTKAQESDILIIVEFPFTTTSNELLALFPMGGEAQIGVLTDPNTKLGSRIAVLSRKPLSALGMQTYDFASAKFPNRGIARFKYSTPTGGDIDFVVVHPPPPKDIAKTAGRDAYLKAASESLTETENFVLIGDFNLTPWEPVFDRLPGKRAGDPRWSRTWNARNFVERITIDHALLGEGIGLSEMNVMRDVGSDHFPLHLVIYPKTQAEKVSSR